MLTMAGLPLSIGVLPTGEPHLGSEVVEWRELEANTIGDLMRQHSDPLKALSTGEIPAIIIRGALGAAEAAAVSKRLVHDPNSLGLFERESGNKKGKQANFGAFGVMLSRLMGLSASQVADRAVYFRRKFEENNLMHPVNTLHRTLEAISAGRKVGVGVHRANNASLSVGGAYRMHFNNVTFPVHFDSLHAKELIRYGCDKKRRKFHWGSASRGRQAEKFEDLHRFPQQLAALITLQRSERPGAEVSVFNLHMKDIAAACEMPIWVTQHNIQLLAAEATNMFVHEHNKQWHQTYGYRVDDMMRWRDQLKIDQRGRPLHLEPGDLYIFDANRVHTVHQVHGGLKRLSLGAFVGFNEDELRIWS